MKVEINVNYEQSKYLKVIAFNRFLDNVEKALRGDAECKDTLLAEDLEDMREYVLPVISQITGWDAPEVPKGDRS